MVGKIARLERNGERFVVQSGGVRQLGKSIQRFCLTGLIALRACDHAGLLHKRSGSANIGAFHVSRLLEKVVNVNVGTGCACRRRCHCHTHLLEFPGISRRRRSNARVSIGPETPFQASYRQLRHRG